MCEPVTIASLALTAATTAYTTYQQKVNADAQEKYQKELHKFNSQVATENALRNYAALQRRQVQEREAAAIDIQQIAAQSTAAQGTARAAAATAGTAGLSVEALVADFERDELAFQDQVRRTSTFRDEQFRLEAEGVRAGLQGQILSTLPQPVQQPDFVGAALRIGASSVSILSNR